MKNKTKISISLKNELVEYLNELSLNKSKFIEKLIEEYNYQPNSIVKLIQ